MEQKEYNYLAVFLGNTDGVREEIEEISVGDKIAWAESKNVSICTFISVFNTDEITEHLTESKHKDDNRNFFVMRVEHSSIFFSNTHIKDRLFYVFDLFGDPGRDYDLNNMTEEEKGILIDEILDKGTNLTPYDQKLLELLTK